MAGEEKKVAAQAAVIEDESGAWPASWVTKPAIVLGFAVSIYMCYATIYGPYRATLVHRALFLGPSLLIYLLVCRPLQGRIGHAIDLVLSAATVAITGYIVFGYDHISSVIGAPFLTTTDLVVGTVLIILVLEAARRQSLVFFAMALICIAYTMGGQYLSGVFQHAGIGFRRFIFLNAFGPEGVFGIGLAVATNYLFMFILFGAALRASGASDFLLRLSQAAVGRYSGGAAKVSLCGSAFLGSVMGSSIGNVVTTGSVTIPVMIRSGYSREEAAAIEVLNSEGAQLVPPVLGAAVFIMAEIINVPYSDLVIASIVPAALYYLSAFLVIHLGAKKRGITGLGAIGTSAWQVLKTGWHLLVPIVVMFFMILEVKVTPALAGVIAVASAIIVAQLRASSRMSLKRVFMLFSDGARDAAVLTGLIASIGLVQQALTITGLGARATEVVGIISGGTQFGLVVASFVATIFLGMGLPTPIAYVLSAIFIAPSLVEAGFPLVATHLFLLFFAIKSGSTPPVAVVAVVASVIAKANWLKTAWLSFFYSIPGWLVAFAFLYDPALLLRGSDVPSIALACVTATVGVSALTAAMAGYLWRPLGLASRALLAASSVCLVMTGFVTDIVGIGAIAVAILLSQARPLSASPG